VHQLEDPLGPLEVLQPVLAQVARALAGRIGPRQRFLVAQRPAHLDALDQLIGRVSGETPARLRACEAVLRRLDSVPGVGRRAAAALLAEAGPDARRFPSGSRRCSLRDILRWW
jgi:transposase